MIKYLGNDFNLKFWGSFLALVCSIVFAQLYPVYGLGIPTIICLAILFVTSIVSMFCRWFFYEKTKQDIFKKDLDCYGDNKHSHNKMDISTRFVFKKQILEWRKNQAMQFYPFLDKEKDILQTGNFLLNSKTIHLEVKYEGKLFNKQKVNRDKLIHDWVKLATEFVRNEMCKSYNDCNIWIVKKQVIENNRELLDIISKLDKRAKITNCCDLIEILSIAFFTENNYLSAKSNLNFKDLFEIPNKTS